MNVYDNGWHWQILHNTSLPCRIWGDPLTEGLGYVMWSRTLHSSPPVMALAASDQEQRNMSQGIILGHSWDRLTKLASLRVQTAVTQWHLVRTSGWFQSSVLRCTWQLLGWVTALPMFMVTALRILQTALGCYTCVKGTVRTCYVFPLVTQYKNNSKFTH
jgi:hypothetical protein